MTERCLIVTSNVIDLVTLPSSLGSLPKLETLLASNNRLTSLPSSLVNLSALKDVSLANNQLKTFPLQFCGLRNLNILDLSHNKLSEVPGRVNELNVIELNVNQNQVTFNL